MRNSCKTGGTVKKKKYADGGPGKGNSISTPPKAATKSPFKFNTTPQAKPKPKPKGLTDGLSKNPLDYSPREIAKGIYNTGSSALDYTPRQVANNIYNTGKSVVDNAYNKGKSTVDSVYNTAKRKAGYASDAFDAGYNMLFKKKGGSVKKKKYYSGGSMGDPKKPTTTGTPATSTPPPAPGMGRPSPSRPGVPTRPLTPPSSQPSRIARPPVQTPQDRFKADEAARKAAAAAARKKADNAAFNERMNQLSKEANPPKKPIGYSRGGTTKKKMASGGPVIAAPIQTRLGNKPMAGGNMAKGGSVHPGFKAVQAKIAAKQGLSKKAAGAILAAGTRKASAKAKAANPRLKRVKG